jgi:amidase
VADAAILLGAWKGGPDPHDRRPGVRAAARRDYTSVPRPAGLKGARIGIPRAFFYDPPHAARAAEGARRPGPRSPR